MIPLFILSPYNKRSYISCTDIKILIRIATIAQQAASHGLCNLDTKSYCRYVYICSEDSRHCHLGG